MKTHFLFLEKDWKKLTLQFQNMQIQVKKLMKEQAEQKASVSSPEDGSCDIVGEPPEVRVLLSRLDNMTKILKNSEVISDTSRTTTFVRLGSSVTIRVDGETEETWLVGSYRVLDKTSENEFSYDAPRIRPLLGLQVGEKTDIVIPAKGALEVEIVAIT